MKKICFLAATCIICSCAFVRVNGEYGFGGSEKVVGAGAVTTSEYTVSEFDKIGLSINADVHYLQAEGVPTVRVEAYENLQEYLKFDVNGNTLEIKAPKGISIRSDKDINVFVTSPSLSSVSIAGSGDFTSPKPVKAEKFNVSIAGSGDVEIDGLSAESLTTEIAGSGDIDVVRMKVTDLKVKIAGSGDIELAGSAENASFSISGSGDISIRDLKVEHMDTKVSGSGSIHK